MCLKEKKGRVTFSLSRAARAWPCSTWMLISVNKYFLMLKNINVFMYLCLVIKEAYSLSFFTSSTLACTAWLDVKYSSRQQFVRFTASWRRSFLQHNTLRLPHLNIIREKFFNIRKTISLKTFIYVFQSVLCFFKWNLENHCWIFPSRNTFKWKFGRTWKSSRTCLVLH